MGEQAKRWTSAMEEHLGCPAWSLFDPQGERSAVGLTQPDAEMICRALNTRGDLIEVASGMLALAQIKFGNLDPLANTAFEHAERVIVAAQAENAAARADPDEPAPVTAPLGMAGSQ